jgi:hypothetical protein
MGIATSEVTRTELLSETAEVLGEFRQFSEVAVRLVDRAELLRRAWRSVADANWHDGRVNAVRDQALLDELTGWVERVSRVTDRAPAPYHPPEVAIVFGSPLPGYFVG